MSERRLFLHSPSGLPSTRARGAKPGEDRYPERALLMARTGDLVCVSAPVDHEYLTWLNAQGVGPAPADVMVVGGAPDASEEPGLAARMCRDAALLARIAARMPADGGLQLHPYAVTPEIWAVAEALRAAGVARVRVAGGDPAATARADCKHDMRARAIELGIPVAEGEVVELQVAGGRRRGDLEPVRAAIQRQLRRTGQVIVRGSLGTIGSSTFVVGRGGDDTDGVVRRLGTRADNRVYLVEALVDLTVSPNLHLRLEDGGGIATLEATDQRWSRPFVHAGNVFPSAARRLDAMEEWARALASALQADGFGGDVGLDFVEYRDPATGAPRAFLAEVNPRVNGAGYPLALRARLNAVRHAAGRAPIGAFASGTIEARAEGFGQLREALGDLLFTHERGAGIVPYLTGWLPRGRCGVVALAAGREEALALHAEAQAAMEAAWAAR